MRVQKRQCNLGKQAISHGCADPRTQVIVKVRMFRRHSRRCGGWRANDKRTRGGRSKLLKKWRSTGFTPGCRDAALLPQRTGVFPGGGRDQGLWPRVTDSMPVWLKQTLRIPPPATMLPPLSSRLSPQASPHPSRLKTKVTLTNPRRKTENPAPRSPAGTPTKGTSVRCWRPCATN